MATLTDDPRAVNASPIERREAVAVRVGMVAAAGAVALGAVVLAGYVLGIHELADFGISDTPARANAALCVLALGLAALLWDRTVVTRRVGFCLAVLALLVAGATVVEWVAPVDLGIDTLLASSVGDHPGLTFGSHPGRPALGAAASLCALAVALLLRDRRLGPVAIADVLASASAGLGIVAILAVSFDGPEIFGVSRRVLLGLPVALSIVLLGGALVASRPRRGITAAMVAESGGAAGLRILVPVAVFGIPLLAGVIWWGRRWLGYDEDSAYVLAVLAVTALCLVVAAWGAQMATLAEEVQAERRVAVERSELRFRTLTERAPVGIFEADASGIVFSNERWSEITGLSLEAAMRGDLAAAIDPKDRAGAVAGLSAAATAGNEFARTFRVRRPDGAVRWVDARASPLPSANGSPTTWLGTVTDITELKLAEQAARLSEARLWLAFEQAPIGMTVATMDGRLERVNGAYCAFTGYRHEELAGISPASITHPDDVPDTTAALRDLAAGDRSEWIAEKRYIHAAGHTIWGSVHVSTIRDEDGRPLRLSAQIEDITSRREFATTVAHMADHDALTGLHNRRCFEQALNREMDRVRGHGSQGAVLILDVDDFKEINDSLGHHTGDELIATTAQSLSRLTPESDLVARIGGDEFAVLVAEADLDEVLGLAESLLGVVREAVTGLDRGHRRVLTASIGIALFGGTGPPGGTGEQLMVNADFALNDAKESGGNCWILYDTRHSKPSRMEARVSVGDRIRRALADDGFVLYAQPIVDLTTGEVVQHEVLIRLPDEHGDLILPGSFIPIAEESGLIQEIDRWVAGQAIGLAAALPCAGPLAINLSGKSLVEPRLLEFVERRVLETGIDPARLIFEVTETAAVANIDVARTFAQRLAGLGCRLSLDDFGAGFGSFYYLKHLPFDFLKIDGEFVHDVLREQSDQLIVRAVVAVANGMGKQVIAEQIEDDAVREFVHGAGVSLGQGFGLGEPVPLDVAFPALAEEEVEAVEESAAEEAAVVPTVVVGPA